MRERLPLLLCCLLAFTTLQAQFAKPLKKKTASSKVFSVGLTGCYAANDMIYSAVSSSAMHPFLAPSFGLVAEWNTMGRFSVGVDVSYVMRGDKEAFATELLTSYSTTTFARVRYETSLNGVELRVPLTCYIGSGSHLRPYVYVAPRFCLWTGGQYRWERLYDDGSYSPLAFEGEVTRVMLRPFDLGAIAGVGLCGCLKLSRMRVFVKLDLGYGVNVMNNFSQSEVDEEVLFQGWGDIGHERLGERRLHNMEARLTLLLPLQRPVPDACDFNQKPYCPK